MKAVKGNKVYSIDSVQKKRYQNDGFDIQDDDGNTIAYSKGKTVDYDQYARLLEEYEKLRDQYVTLLGEHEKLKEEYTAHQEECKKQENEEVAQTDEKTGKSKKPASKEKEGE